jgi:hypothetical protein
MESLLPIIIQAIAGAAGGNIIGAVLKNFSLGTAGNSIAGILGGAGGGQLLGSLIGGGGAAGGIIGQLAGGAAGGGVLMVIVGIVRQMMNKS